MDVSELCVGRRLLWRDGRGILETTVHTVMDVDDGTFVTLQWGPEGMKRCRYYRTTVLTCCVALCADCGHTRNEHDTQTGKCLFGAGVWR